MKSYLYYYRYDKILSSCVSVFSASTHSNSSTRRSEVRTRYEEVVRLAAGVSRVMEATGQILLTERQLLAHRPLPRHGRLV